MTSVLTAIKTRSVICFGHHKTVFRPRNYPHMGHHPKILFHGSQLIIIVHDESWTLTFFCVLEACLFSLRQAMTIIL